MRKTLMLAAIAAAVVIVPSASAQTTSPTITVDRIDCAPLAEGEHLGSASLLCIDDQDGVTFAVHQLDGQTWLTVVPSDGQ